MLHWFAVSKFFKSLTKTPVVDSITNVFRLIFRIFQNSYLQKNILEAKMSQEKQEKSWEFKRNVRLSGFVHNSACTHGDDVATMMLCMTSCHHLLVQSQWWKHQKNVWNLFKVNNKDTNVPFLYPLKTSENQRFSDVFRGYTNGTLLSLLLTLNRFHRLLWCFHYWLWTYICQLGSLMPWYISIYGERLIKEHLLFPRHATF